jgi:DNA-binding LacI/PurR family transcriptional regulator
MIPPPGNGKPRTSPSRKPATLADVAAMAGVVAMTASRALNNTGYVSKEVRERVAAAAAELHYRPNVLARQLRGSRLQAIGILLPDIANPFSAELMRGINPVLQAAGYTGFIASARGIDEERAALQSFVDHRIDGLIVASRNTEPGDHFLRTLSGQGIALATIGRPMDAPAVDCVNADHYQGAFDAVTHLVSLGHRRIGFIGASSNDATRFRRFDGYLAALEAAGIEADPAYAIGSAAGPGFATEEDGCDGFIVLHKLRKPPTAVFARNDYAAIGAIRAAYTLGLRIPQDVAIAGFDNIPLAAYQTPPLTTVEQPIAEQGRLAAEFLLQRIEVRARRMRQSVQLPCRLIVRDSTGAAAKLPEPAPAKRRTRAS